MARTYLVKPGRNPHPESKQKARKQIESALRDDAEISDEIDREINAEVEQEQHEAWLEWKYGPADYTE